MPYSYFGKGGSAMQQIDAVPVYETIICGLRLNRMKLDEEIHERERDVLVLTINFCQKSRELLDHFNLDTPKQPDKESLLEVNRALEVLNAMMPNLLRHVRRALDLVSQEFRMPVQLLLQELEGYADRLDGLVEAWQMPLDDDLVEGIKEAIQAADSVSSQPKTGRISLPPDVLI